MALAQNRANVATNEHRVVAMWCNYVSCRNSAHSSKQLARNREVVSSKPVWLIHIVFHTFWRKYFLKFTLLIRVIVPTGDFKMSLPEVIRCTSTTAPALLCQEEKNTL